jgi:hypothetical protein
MAFQKRSLEAQHMGLEPDPNDWDGLTEEQLTEECYNAFRWYYKFYDFKECMEFVSEYYKMNKVKTTSPKKIKPVDLMEVGMHVGYIARLKTRGCGFLPEKFEELFIEKLKKIESIAEKRQHEQKEAQAEKVKPNIQERMRILAKNIRYDIEEIVDEQLENDFKIKFNFKSFIKQNKISKPVAKHLKTEINELADEIRLSKTDPDLKEAYSHLNGIIKNKLIKFYDTLIEECDNIQTVRKEKDKPVKLNWYRRNKNKKKKKK